MNRLRGHVYVRGLREGTDMNGAFSLRNESIHTKSLPPNSPHVLDTFNVFGHKSGSRLQTRSTCTASRILGSLCEKYVGWEAVLADKK